MKHIFPLRIATVLLLATLAACNQKTEQAAPNLDPTVANQTVHFPANAPELQRLVTSPVLAAQENLLSLPARLVWDEDHTSRISAPVAGRLDEILVQAGSTVHGKQVLAYLRSSELDTARSEAARAEADLTQSERNLARVQALLAANGAAGKELEQAQADVARSRAEAHRTQLRLEQLGAANSSDARYALRSPINGVLVERNTNPGMEWRPDQPSAPLFVVSDPSYLWCWIDAPEGALSLLHSGMKVILRSAAYPQESVTGQVDYVADGLDPVSRTVKVRAHLRNPQRHLKGEMYVTAELSSQARGALDVPAKAVFLSHGEQHVFVKTGHGEYTRRSIAPLASSDTWVSIAQGLNKGDEVVVDGGLYLQKILDEAGNTPLAAASAVSATAK